MRIVEEDFVMEPCGAGTFDLILKRKVKDKETGEFKLKEFKSYGCTLSSCLQRIARNRVRTKFESESPCLFDLLKTIIKLDEEIVKLCKEPLPENFDDGG